MKAYARIDLLVSKVPLNSPLSVHTDGIHTRGKILLSRVMVRLVPDENAQEQTDRQKEWL